MNREPAQYECLGPRFDARQIQTDILTKVWWNIRKALVFSG
jgi:hypothetical protein